MKIIPVKLRNKKASVLCFVDDEDFEYLNQFKWHLHTGGYPQRNMKAGDGRRKPIRMHREVMNTPKGIETDHRDRNPLNNQKENLRNSTKSQNQWNKGKCKNNKSGLKGVYWHKRDKRWRADIMVNGKHIYLGYFMDKLEAAKAYDEAAKKYHGEFARTNINNNNLNGKA